jgi:transcriptional regulator with XRE-family HTH domain
MLSGRERLKAWVERSKVTQREAARILGLDHTFLSQILNGRRTPALANAVKIERVTGIAAEAWLPTDDGETADHDTQPTRKPQIGKAQTHHGKS